MVTSTRDASLFSAKNLEANLNMIRTYQGEVGGIKKLFQEECSGGCSKVNWDKNVEDVFTSDYNKKFHKFLVAVHPLVINCCQK